MHLDNFKTVIGFCKNTVPDFEILFLTFWLKMLDYNTVSTR